MRARNVRPRQSRGWILLAIGTAFAPIAQASVSVWTSSGPYGGYVAALAVDPATPTTLYAGTAGEGVLKSTDSGRSWSPANTGLTKLSIYALAIDPSTPTTLYAGTNHGEVFKSTDAGRTWAARNNGLPSPARYIPELFVLTINPATPSTLYAGTPDGVFRSTDAGETWSAASTGLVGYVNCLAIDPLTPATIYAGTDRGVFKSTDGGGTWVAANTGLTRPYVLALAIDPVTPATLYAATNLGGIFRSTDSGDTWQAVNTGLTDLNVKALLIDPSTPSTLYAGTTVRGFTLKGDGVFRSTDSGQTWVAQNTGLTNPTIAALAINPSAPATLYAGTWGGGIFRSFDAGGTWTGASSGMNSLSVSAIAIDPANPATVYAGTGGFGGYGFFKSTDAGRTWAASTPGQPYPNINCLAINPAASSTIYAGTEGGGVFKSTDAGATWADSSAGLTNKWVWVLAVDPSNPSILYAGTYLYDGAAVFKSTDAGGSWEAADTGLTNQAVRDLAIDPSVPSTLYAATDSGIFKSTDSAGNWAAVGSTITYVNALAIDPSTPATIYAGTNSGIFESTDSGANWTQTGLTNKQVKALAINPSKPATLYAGTYGSGVFGSTDLGGRWSAINAGLPGPTDRSVEVLALDPTGPTTLYSGLLIGGLWQWTPPAEPVGSSSFVPIVLDVVGLAHYTSELQLTNLGASSVTVNLSYTSSIGSGAGHIEETLPAGQQAVYPDAVSYLRTRGVPIATSGNQGGTLLLSAPAPGVHATVRTAADTVAPQPLGRAGLAYTADDPASSLATKLYVYGLRTNDADRSNLAVYNMGAEPVSLKVTLVSGDDGSSFEVTAGTPLVLPGYGWYQYGDGLLLRVAGFTSGYAIIEWVSGSGPFGAYGVINDQRTNDGSFVPALPGTPSGTRLTLPVLVETPDFDSELILTNRGGATATFTLRYLESLSPARGLGGWTTVEVAAGRQEIIPGAIDFLRSKGLDIGARGEASYAGSLRIQVSDVALEDVFAGGRTTSPSPAGGEYGLFYPAVDPSQEFSDTAFILGLKADMYNRSNVAVVHTGEDGSGPIRLELQVMDGSEGGRPAGPPLLVELDSGQWAQPARFFAGGNVPNGYVRIRRTDGTAPWYAYGVIHDGSQPGQRTGDGSYVPGVR